MWHKYTSYAPFVPMNLARDRIKQAKFFITKAREIGFSDRDAFRYYIEAAIVAERSVTHLLQKQYDHVPGFHDWYTSIQTQLHNDPLAHYVLQKRNFVLKEGPATIRNVISVSIHDAFDLDDSLSFRVKRGSWKRRLKHFPENLIFSLKEKWAALKRRYRWHLKKPKVVSTASSEVYYFVESDWSNKPAIDLLEDFLDRLQSIIDECTSQFGDNPTGTNDA